MSLRPDARGRVHLPTLIAGLCAGAVLAGGLVPLLGDPRAETSTNDLPGFFDDTSRSGTVDQGDIDTDDPGEGNAPESDGSTSDSVATDSVATDSVATTLSPDPGGGPTPNATRTASDVGVTKDKITLGAAIMRCAACPSLGVELSLQGADIARAFAADINARGGINGRQVELVVRTFDLVNDALTQGGTEREACIAITEEHAVFAAINMLTTTPECYYDEHGLPTLISYPLGVDDPTDFNNNGGRIWSVRASARRTVIDWARQATSLGLLKKGEPFGIVTTRVVRLDEAVFKYLIPELRRLGYEPAHVTTLPADYSAQPVAIATENAAMRRKGIETVVLMTEGSSVTWVEESERNGWRPKYVASDHGAIGTDTGETYPESFVGATVMSTDPGVDLKLSSVERRCIDVWERASGAPMKEVDKLYVFDLCNMFRMFELGATESGLNPTRVSLVEGFASIGHVDVAGTVSHSGTLGGSYEFGPAKWSAVDATVMKRWDGDTWRYVSGPYRMQS